METTIGSYLKEVFARNLHLIRSWRLQAFAIKEKHVLDAYYPTQTEAGVGFYNDEKEFVLIKGMPKVVGFKAVLPHYTEFKITPDDMEIVKEPVDTTISAAMLNYMAFSKFHPRYPYLAGVLSPDDLSAPFLKDIIAGDTDADYNKTFIETMSSLEAIYASDSEFIVRSFVRGQFGVDKKHLQLRDKLIAENKDNLEDPIVIANIQGELAKSTAKRYKEVGATLWEGGKSHAVTLAKTDGAYGSEMSIEGKNSKFIVKSLREGIDLRDLGTHVGVARYGSYGRGKLTAEGGAFVNDAYKALEVRRGIEGDCGSKRGIPKRIRKHNYKQFVGQPLAGTQTYLTEDMLKLHIGQTIVIRSPFTCKSPIHQVCSFCGGREIARMPDSIATKASGLMSSVMNSKMQATHGKQATLTEVDFIDDIY